MKLKKRLTYVLDLIKKDYDHIYDTCCDHGYLGMNLIERNQAKIHFIDCVPHIIKLLTNQLETLNFDKSKYTIKAIHAQISQIF